MNDQTFANDPVPSLFIEPWQHGLFLRTDSVISFADFLNDEEKLNTPLSSSSSDDVSSLDLVHDVTHDIVDGFFALPHQPSNICQTVKDNFAVTHVQAPARARTGQRVWRAMKHEAEAEWKKLKIANYNPHFNQQIQEAKKQGVKCQKLCLLYKLQIAAVDQILEPHIDNRTSNWTGFRVLRPGAFRRYFDAGLAPKSFCNIWRRAGFEPKNKRWEDAFNGLAVFSRA